MVTLSETNETFFVNLSGAVNASIQDGQGLGTISNDDGVPSISISDATATEGNQVLFTVSLSNTSGQTITVDFSTTDGVAVGGDDYQFTAGTLTFDPGQSSQTIAVTTNDDALNELDEQFSVALSNPTIAFLNDGQGNGTIVDNDLQPTVTIADASANEGMTGTTALTFRVTLSAVSGRTVTVNYDTADGTATTGDNDYQSGPGKVDLANSITVLVNGDSVNEQQYVVL